jgi:hypothetical protein
MVEVMYVGDAPDRNLYDFEVYVLCCYINCTVMCNVLDPN